MVAFRCSIYIWNSSRLWWVCVFIDDISMSNITRNCWKDIMFHLLARDQRSVSKHLTRYRTYILSCFFPNIFFFFCLSYLECSHTFYIYGLYFLTFSSLVIFCHLLVWLLLFLWLTFSLKIIVSIKHHWSSGNMDS